MAAESEFPTRVVSRVYERENALTTCPVCGGAAFGWLTLPDPESYPTVGRLADVDRIIDLCETCGTGVERGGDVIDAAAELARTAAAGPVPNRASWQGWLGGDSWSELHRWNGRLLFTPRAVARIEGGGEDTSLKAKARTRSAIGPMWQTMLNAFTFNQNFAREVRAGRLRPSSPGGRGTAAFCVDCVVTVLAAPLTGLAAVLSEWLATALGRGGIIDSGKPGS